jgi:hypothetical protein
MSRHPSAKIDTCRQDTVFDRHPVYPAQPGRQSRQDPEDLASTWGQVVYGGRSAAGVHTYQCLLVDSRMAKVFQILRGQRPPAMRKQPGGCKVARRLAGLISVSAAGQGSNCRMHGTGTTSFSIVDSRRRTATFFVARGSRAGRGHTVHGGGAR